MAGSGELDIIDASVGSLVWVRRRNGSWWPGTVVGVDELSEDFLESPKSGTPVKLLGRLSACVDWYNLEKSKRVKAFRCGEFDECIERAKASAANSGKKLLKYARREDAIIDALELEGVSLSKDGPDLFPISNNAYCEDHDCWPEESPTMSCSSKENEDMAYEVSTIEDNSNSTQELSQSGLSFEEPNQITPKVKSTMGKRRKTPNDSDDDGTEGIKRMRGLEDLGMGVITTKRKPLAGKDLNLVKSGTISPCDSNTANSLPIGSYMSGGKGLLSSKRKRCQVAKVQEVVKRKNRCRPLTKVLESTAMFSVPVMCDEPASPCRSSLHGLSNDFKRSIVNNSSESAGISCENGMPLNSSEPDFDAPHFNSKLMDNEISSMSDIPKNKFSGTLFDVPFVGEEKCSAELPGSPPMNVKFSSGRLQAGAVGRQYSPSSQEEIISSKNEEPNESGSTSSAAAHINNISESIEKSNSKWKSKGKRKSRHLGRKKRQNSRNYADVGGKSNACIVHQDGILLGNDCRDDSSAFVTALPPDSCTSQEEYREITAAPLGSFQHALCRNPQIRGSTADVEFLPDSTQYSGLRNYCAESLYNVNLEVKAGYRPQHVPLVSLVCRDGKAIVGHPVTVEVLADGSCDLATSSSELNDVLSGGTSDREGGTAKCNPNVGRVCTKHVSLHTLCSPNKLPKRRKCRFVPKKTRRLSSLTGSLMQRVEGIKPVVEKPKCHIVACVPLKLVFSRLNEAVNNSAHQIATPPGL